MPFDARTALRVLSRHKAYAAINVVGLAVALAACLLIALHVQDELAFDRFHAKSDRIVQVLLRETREGETKVIAQTPIPMAEAMESTFPEVERAVRVTELSGVVRHGEAVSRERVTFVSEGFFDTFSFGMAVGDPSTALRTPGGIVLSSSFARRAFGDGPAIGERVSVRVDDSEREFTVTGVAHDPPAESSVRFDVLMSMASLAQYRRSYADPNWMSLNPRVYLELDRAASAGALAPELPAFLSAHVPDWLADQWSLELLPLEDVHLTPGVEEQLVPPRSPVYSVVLGGVGLLILLMACINFTTLTVGRSAHRAREVGVRKAVGAVRAQLVRQFWGETLVLALVALVLGVMLAQLALPTFNDLVGREVTIWRGLDLRTPLTLAGLLALVAVVAGSYPALYLSSFEPVRVLSGRTGHGGRAGLTGALVTLQFVISTALVIVLLVMARQMHLVASKDLGFESEHVVRIPTNVWDAGEGGDFVGRFRTALADDPRVLSVTGLSEDIGDEGAFANNFAVTPGDHEVRARVLGADAGLVETLGLTVRQGRGLSVERTADVVGAALVVNQALVDAMGWDEPVGQVVSVDFTASDATVVGVVDDFHFRSLRSAVEPLVVHMRPPWFRSVYVRLAPGPLPERLASLREAWADVAPGFPFEPTLLDDTVGVQYAADRRWTRVVALASVFAVCIGCLGLLGLTSLAAEQRTKEIGIRRVLGATVAGIVVLLSKDVVWRAALAFVIAAPLAYLALDRWLETFAYRTDLGPGPFLAAGLLTLLVSVLTVGTRSLRAATADPVRALRSE